MTKASVCLAKKVGMTRKKEKVWWERESESGKGGGKSEKEMRGVATDDGSAAYRLRERVNWTARIVWSDRHSAAALASCGPLLWWPFT